MGAMMSAVVPTGLLAGKRYPVTVVDVGGAREATMQVSAGGKGTFVLSFETGGGAEGSAAAAPAKEYEFRRGTSVAIPSGLRARLKRFLETYDAGCLAERVGCARSAINRLVDEKSDRAKKPLLDAVDAALTEAGYRGSDE